MIVSRPTAASAMLVTLGGTEISSRSGSTIIAGRSTVNSWLSRFCRQKDRILAGRGQTHLNRCQCRVRGSFTTPDYKTARHTNGDGWSWHTRWHTRWSPSVTVWISSNKMIWLGCAYNASIACCCCTNILACHRHLAS
jgi:hypothetical protein